MKTIISNREDALFQAEKAIERLLEKKPDAVIALSAADDCLPLYELFSNNCSEGKLSLSHACFFAVEELEELPAEDEHSAVFRLRTVLDRTDAAKENCFFLTAETLGTYDDEISKRGGLDLAVLGIGANARIGFNEPATPFGSLSHRQKLTPSTRRELSERFGGEDKMPAYGLTMGIKTLVQAREIMLLAAGDRKAKAVFDMLYGRDDSTVPAAFLQIPSEVTLYLDESAAAKL